MSGLFGAARQASEYMRRRMSLATRDADEQIEDEAINTYLDSRRSLARRLAKFIFGRTNRRYPQNPALPPFQVPGSEDGTPTPPPVQPPDGWGGIAVPPPFPPDSSGSTPPPPPPPRGKGGGSSPPRPPRPPLGHPDPPKDDDGGDGAGDGYDDIEILGRDASYDRDDWKVVMDQMRLTPGSTNVYGYYFEFESRTTGILYVTFLADYRGQKLNGPGTTYAYYTVAARKYHQFQEAAAASAGNAVWDFLRIRGTIWGHQYQYRLIQSHGDYIPRKATKKGYRTRHVAAIGATGRRSYRDQRYPSGCSRPAASIEDGRTAANPIVGNQAEGRLTPPIRLSGLWEPARILIDTISPTGENSPPNRRE